MPMLFTEYAMQIESHKAVCLSKNSYAWILINATIWCMVYLVFIYSMCLCLAVVISVMHIRYGRPWLPLFTIECIYYGTDNQILRLPCTSRVLRQEQRQNRKRKRKRKHFAESSIAVTSRLSSVVVVSCSSICICIVSTKSSAKLWCSTKCM